MPESGPFSIQSKTINGSGRYLNGDFVLDQTKEIIFSKKDISAASQVTESEAKDFVAKVGWGTAAFIGLSAIFSGGLGLLGAGAALLATGNNKKIAFLVTLKNGGQYIISASDKIFLEIMSSLI